MPSSNTNKQPSLAVLSSRLTSATLPSDAIAALTALLGVIKESYQSATGDGAVGEPTPAARELVSSPSVMGALCTLLGSPSYLERDHGAGRLVMDGSDGGGGGGGAESAGRGAELACELALALLGGGDEEGGGDDDGKARAGATAGRQKMAKLASEMLTFSALASEVGSSTGASGGGGGAVEGQFLNAILDRLCPTEDASAEGGGGGGAPSLYPRILSLAVLRRLHTLVPHVVQNQLLTAVPDGLNRLIALLGGSGTQGDAAASAATSAPPEELRNDILRLLTDLSAQSSNAARLVIFSEGYERALSIATDPISQGGEGGLYGGNAAIVGDCLELCTTLTTSVEEMGAEVVLGSGGLLDRIGGLLDLRGGRKFRNPALMVQDDSGDKVAGEDDADDDDLDDILSGAKDKSAGSKGGTARSSKVAIPWLTGAEEKVVERVLLLLAAIVGEESGDSSSSSSPSSSTKVASRKARIIRHEKTCRFLLDLALFAHPPPNALAYPHGAPSLALQCRALETVALLARGVDETTLDVLVGRKSIFLRDVSVMERLLYLIVTGGGLVGSPASSGTVDDQILSAQRLSNHALSALRATLRGKSASVMISHALAPPPMEEDMDSNIPVPPAEVTKLINTLVENLHGLSYLPPDISDEDEMQLIQRGRTVVCAAGAASALSVFLSVTKGETGSMAREMLLGVPLPPPMPQTDSNNPHRNLLECLLGYLETVSSDKEGTNKWRYDSSLACTLLRFLLEWVGWSFDCISPDSKPSSEEGSEEKGSTTATCTMAVMMALLSSPSSVTLGSYAKNPPPFGQSASVKALAAILLGLALDAIFSGDKDGRDGDDDIGGWTEDSIMTVLTGGKRDLGKFTKLIEVGAKDGGAEGTWILCESERKSYVKSYTHAVRVVRRRVIKQLTAGGDDGESEEEDDVTGDSQLNNGANAGGKTVMRLLAKQTTELESLRDRLEQSEQLSAEQARQLDRWKHRVESNPTQLDAMLTDISNKNDELVRANKQSENVIKDKDALIEQFKAERDEAVATQAAVIQADPAELSSFKDENSRLKRDVRAANEWMQMATKRMEEMGKRTTELEAAATAPPPPPAASDADLSKISSLEEENSRLRKDVRAANEWMQMATKRMEEMGQQNAKLEATAASAAGSSSTEELASLRSQLEADRAKRETLAFEIQVLQGQNAEVTDELQKTNDRMVSAADTSANELASLRSDLDTERDNNAALATEVQALQAKNSELENDTSANELASLRSDLDAERDNSAALATEVQALQAKNAELENLQLSDDTPPPIDAKIGEEKDNEIQQLKTEVSSVRSELEQAAASSTQQLNKYQATIQSLQEQVDAQMQELADAQRLHVEELQHLQDSATASDEELRSQIDELQKNMAIEREQAESAAKAQAADSEALQAKLNAIREEAKRGLEAAKGPPLDAMLEMDVLQAKVVVDAAAGSSSDASAADVEEANATAQFLSQYYQEEIALISQDYQAYRDEVEASSSLVADGFDAVRVELAKKDDEYAALSNEYQSYKESIDASSSVVADGFDAVRLELAKKDEETTSMQQELNVANASLGELKVVLETKEEECATSKENLAASEANLAKIQEEMTVLEENLAAIEGQSEAVVSEWQARVEELERLVESLEEQIRAQEEEADEAISKWSKRCSFLEAEASSADKSEPPSSVQLEQVSSLRSELKSKDEAIEELRRKVVQVADETAEAVTEKLDSEIKDLRDTVSKLETENGTLVGKNASLVEETQILEQAREEIATLRSNLEDVKTELATLQGDLSEKDAELAQTAADYSADKGYADARIQLLEADVAELNSTITSVHAAKKDLEDQLATAEAEAAAEVAKADAARQAERESFEEDIMGTSEHCNAIIAQWEETVLELELKLVAVNEELQAQEADAEEAIREWEARCSLLETQGSSQESSLQEKVTDLEAQLKEKDEAFANLQCTLEEQEAASFIAAQKSESSVSVLEKQLAEREEEVNALKEEFVISGEQSENVIEQWQERVQELEASLNDAETLCAEADSAIAQWEGRCDELQVELVTSQKQGGEGRSALEARIRELEDSDGKKQFELEEVGIKLMATQVEIEDVSRKLDAATESKSLIEKELGEKLSALSLQLADKQSELEEMKAGHEKELSLLRRSGEAVRAEEHIAMKEVVDSLETDNARLLEVIGELKEQLRDALDSLQCNATDHISQRATEIAVESLRTEMLNARGLHRSSQPEDGRMPSESGRHSERTERDELRTALERTKEELLVTRSKLQALEETVASSRVDMVASAQEARATKSSLAAIRQAFEDRQNRELTTKASLEHQISCLMSAGISRGNTKEVETLTSEVVQLNAEKERLLQLLSQKEQLISSSTMRDIRDDTAPEPTQLTQLRLEKQQLLTKSAEITQRLEQRMREAIAAATSYRETDRLVEEFRDYPSPPPTPDNTSQKMKAQRDISQFLARPDQEANLRAAKTEAAKLKDENRLLQADLERSNAEAEKTIRRLKEQCRKYAESHRTGGPGSESELAIAGEVSRLRGEFRSEKLLGSMTTAEVLDTVVQLKETIEDERSLYRELVEEHKDLLALVAQYEEEVNATR